MQEFTLLDGFYLMLIAMLIVFIVLAGLWGIMVLVGKIVNRKSEPADRTAPEMEKERVDETSQESDDIPPEVISMIVALLIEQEVEKAESTEERK